MSFSSEVLVNMRETTFAFLRDEDGQDLIEYALLCSFVAVAASTGAQLLGSKLNAWYSALATAVGSLSTSLGGGNGNGNGNGKGNGS